MGELPDPVPESGDRTGCGDRTALGALKNKLVILKIEKKTSIRML